MATKANPGKFDCLKNLPDDEPHFVLVAHDASAPGLVRRWALKRQELIRLGLKPQSDQAQVEEALECADNMDAWRFTKKLAMANQT